MNIDWHVHLTFESSAKDALVERARRERRSVANLVSVILYNALARTTPNRETQQ